MLSACGSTKVAEESYTCKSIAPRCVSSVEPEGSKRYISPIRFKQTSQPVRMIEDALVEMGGMVQSKTRNVIRATFKSKRIGFVDDVVLVIDTNRSQIGVRSSSRLGYYDFEVNRKRVEHLRLLLSRL